METSPYPTNASPCPVVPVDFKARRRPALKHLGKGVYAYPRPCKDCGVSVHPRDPKCPACGAAAPDVCYFERPFVDGRQTTRKLTSTKLRHAQLEVGRLRSDQALARVGRAANPYARANVATVSELADGYLQADCPKRDGHPRSGLQLQEVQRHVATIRRHLGHLRWAKLGFEDLAAYHERRLAEVGKGGRSGRPAPSLWTGNRTVEIEETILSSIFRWAVRHQRQTGVTSNPVAHDRPQHCRPETIRHCRDVMPASGDELHNLARALFEDAKSQVLGWQLLFEAFFGQRSHEIIQLRMDAKAPGEAGFRQGNHLYLFHSKTSKGTYPYADLGVIPSARKAVQECLATHAIWHQKRFPAGSPWYFPSHHGGGQEPVLPSALTHALRRVTQSLGLPHRTSHGLRSYYVNVLRSHGKLDAEIALRIGHRTGGKLIVQVYGEILPSKISWLPEASEPAWVKFLPGRDPRPEQMELGIL